MKHITVTKNILSIDEVERLLSNDGTGGQVYFVGTVRNRTNDKQVISLEFECYEPMAIKEMTKIANETEIKWAVQEIVIHHRIGKLEIGEYPVIIGAASAHRQDAFEACQYMIDKLKETAPIWKKEFFVDGEIWVSAHP